MAPEGAHERVCKGSGRCRHVEDEVAQKDIGDAESISGDVIREPRRRNSPSDPTSREIEHHVQTRHASFRSWCASCVRGRGRAERHKAQGRKELDDGFLVVGLLFRWKAGIESTRPEVEQRGDSPVLVMHDGVTKSILAHLIPAKSVDFPSCEKVVNMIIKDLDNLGYHRVVFRCDH